MVVQKIVGDGDRQSCRRGQHGFINTAGQNANGNLVAQSLPTHKGFDQANNRAQEAQHGCDSDHTCQGRHIRL